MPPTPPIADGVLTLSSRYSVPETLDRLEAILHEKNIKVFARIDQGAEAFAAKLTLAPTQILLFGNPRGGTPIMQAAPLAAIDLPLKALAWQDAEGAVWLSFLDPDFLATRFQLASGLITPLRAMRALLEQAVS